MIVVAIAMQKGGVGKSTLTRSLGVAAAADGLTPLILDMDLQQSSTQWGKRRTADFPAVKFVTEMDLEETLQRAQTAGCDLVLIDTPPARSSEAPAAVERADLVLIPCTPDVEAYEQLPRTARLARTCGVRAVAVLNMATPGSKSEIKRAEEVFEMYQVVKAPVEVRRLKTHRTASTYGQAATELAPVTKAASDIRGLWDWLKRELAIDAGGGAAKRSA